MSFVVHYNVVSYVMSNAGEDSVVPALTFKIWLVCNRSPGPSPI